MFKTEIRKYLRQNLSEDYFHQMKIESFVRTLAMFSDTFFANITDNK